MFYDNSWSFLFYLLVLQMTNGNSCDKYLNEFHFGLLNLPNVPIVASLRSFSAASGVALDLFGTRPACTHLLNLRPTWKYRMRFINNCMFWFSLFLNYLHRCVDFSFWLASCAPPVGSCRHCRLVLVHVYLFACSHHCPTPGSLAPSSDWWAKQVLQSSFHYSELIGSLFDLSLTSCSIRSLL